MVLPTTQVFYYSDADSVVETVGPDERKITLTGLKPSTKYRVFVQPFNKTGNAKLSSTAHVVTQDGENMN